MRFRNRNIAALDLVFFSIAPFATYALRFEGWDWPNEHRATAIVFGLVQLPIALTIAYLFGMYRRLWRYASITELEVIGVAGATVAIVNGMVGAFVLPAFRISPVRVPLSVLFTYGLLAICILALPRLSARVWWWRGRMRQSRLSAIGTSRALIAGAGKAGELILRELLINRDLAIEPIGFIDDDAAKVGMQLGGLPVLGGLADLERIAKDENADQLIIAMPRAAGGVVRELVRAAYSAGVKTRTVPGLFELISGHVSVNTIRDVRIEDLLRRDPVETDLASLSALCAGKTVMVTGAGGSIGSELSRQIAPLRPGLLVVVGHGENPIFEISHELRAMNQCEVVSMIADIRDPRRLRHIFEQLSPHVVFHAAAHKHVPLMEENVVEAITNNVLGTKNVVDAAVRHGTQHLVLISTDKAVRPTNVMGATKRVAEYLVHDAAIRHRRNFVAVRFGNVLGSQGSVVPTFRRQIREGGPVTVTHPEMRRYFMTIPEAVQLVLQAAGLGKGGEFFMLDMGEHVKIVDLARDMIRLSGLEEGVDIEIAFTGIRPGEKLYEEMFFSHEVAERTGHPKILRARAGTQHQGNLALIETLIAGAVHQAPESELRQMLIDLVPDYTCGDLARTPASRDWNVRAKSDEIAVRSLDDHRRASGAHRPLS